MHDHQEHSHNSTPIHIVAAEVLSKIKQRVNGPTAAGMLNHGILYKVNYGVSIPELVEISKEYAPNHELAIELYRHDARECKIIASMIAEPDKMNGELIDEWAEAFTNTEIVEQVCNHLLWKADCALSRSIEWCIGSDDLLQKAGLLIVGKSASNNNIKDAIFEPYIGIIDSYNNEQVEQNKTSIAFALRQIAKRNQQLTAKVIRLAQQMSESDNESVAWVGNQLIYDIEDQTIR